ncbi:MAG: hypothetical protein MUD08_04650 [Cytophagales bacterium]|jgi:hypothetical protein|nr:hypothetical protein [Cytophagales bacterium]
MTDARLTLFPTNPFSEIPDPRGYAEKLAEVGFLEPNTFSSSGFVLGRIFRELLDAPFDEIEHYHIPAWLAFFDGPQLQIGENLAQLDTVRNPYGEEIGDAHTARELLAELRQDPAAVWRDPRTQRPFPIASLDFDHTVAYGNHFLHLGIYVSPTDTFLRLLGEQTGIGYDFAFYRAEM